MIPTSDWRYLLGGRVRNGFFASWLVKIDEEGNILEDNVSSLSEKEEIQGEKIKVFPNPVSSVLNIELIDFDINSMYEVQIVDVDGTILFNKHLTNQKYILDIADTYQGIYVVTVVKNQQVIWQQKIVKVLSK